MTVVAERNMGLKATVLLVDDDRHIATIMGYNLKKEGYNVVTCFDGSQVMSVVRKVSPDLILLDWVLPFLSGLDVLTLLRNDEEFKNIPVIMISAKNEEFDKVTGLQKGADDYIVKPFSFPELAARIKALLNRMRPVFSGRKLLFEDIVMELSMHRVTRNGGKEVKLAPIEFRILQILMETPGRVASREEIMSKIWGGDVYVSARTVDVHVTRLRKALMKHSPTGADVIKTVRLVGYALNVRDNS